MLATMLTVEFVFVGMVGWYVMEATFCSGGRWAENYFRGPFTFTHDTAVFVERCGTINIA